MDDIPSFGAWLKRRRKTLDLTQDALPRLVLFLVSSPRRRRHHGADIRQWLDARLWSAQPLLEAA